MHQIVHIVGARPNFMKAAPVIAAIDRRGGVEQKLIHTGQHYDANMSDIFFQQLGLPSPDINLEVGSGSHAVQTAQTMIRFEEVVQTRRPDVVLVYGDVNSTVATTLVCAKLGIPVGHVEAGLRSSDRTMPEEINRLLTDQIADLLFTPSHDGDENLLREGIAAEKIHLVGNVMIDTLLRLLPVAEQRWARGEVAARRDEPYALVTLHRPSNVDEPVMLGGIVAALARVSQRLPVIFPVHPRTRQRMKTLNLAGSGAIHLTDPLGYLDFLALQRHATVVITDSGGIQEETTLLGVPCLTVRENTERPVTVTLGTNVLVGRDMARLEAEVASVLDGQFKRGQVPPLWDGKAGERIAAILEQRR
jgi:UDP-N-acetylglucosamine 2-epimerase (non-hydrolysing)